MSGYVVEFGDVQEAAGRLTGMALRTPVLTSPALDEAAGCSLFLKCEHMQRVGAFKFRGAWNAISSLSEEEGGVHPQQWKPCAGGGSGGQGTRYPCVGGDARERSRHQAGSGAGPWR